MPEGVIQRDIRGGFVMDYQMKRLISCIMYQVQEEGRSQFEAFNWLEESEKEAFKADIEKYVSRISIEDLSRTRVFVTNSIKQCYSISALKKGTMLIRNRYQIFMANDRKIENGLIIYVVFCKQPQKERISCFLTQMFGTKPLAPALTKLLTCIDTSGGITFHQVLKNTFDKKYGTRTTRFKICDEIEAIYDDGEVVITSDEWIRFVRFSKAVVPWRYRYEFDSEGFRFESSFRYDLYGSIFKESKK